MKDLEVNITLEYDYGDLKKDNTYTIQELLDEIDRLQDKVDELESDVKRLSMSKEEYEADMLYELKMLGEI